MDLKSKIESLLFVSGNSLSLDSISKILNIKKHETEELLLKIKNDLEKNNRGIQIAVVDKKYQMVTNPKNSEIIEKFLNQEIIGELTRPQLETLTIITYRGPILKIELEQIRGVNCSLILRNLMIRGLIESKTVDGIDRYIITHDFLKYLGLTDIKELPDYKELNKDRKLEDLLDRGNQ